MTRNPCLLLLVAAAALTACFKKDPPPAPTPKTCVGGVIDADGGCSAKCDASKCVANNTCVNNACALKCGSHLECGKSQRCVEVTEDDSQAAIFVCADADMKDIGKPCLSATDCGGQFICNSSGPGDVNAYCVGMCLDDEDCPGGFECGYRRDPIPLCAPDGGTAKGNNGFCGETDAPCLQPSELTPDQPLIEGEFCLLRKVCMKRTACAPCETDVDCSLSGTKCVPFGASKVCAPACAVDSDCTTDKGCVNGACVPNDGVCAGPGFCSPCRYDPDCGPGYGCARLHGEERSCVDLKFEAACSTDEDCPVAPSGMHGHCLGEADGVAPGEDIYHRCYAPQDKETEAFTCYPSRPKP